MLNYHGQLLLIQVDLKRFGINVLLFSFVPFKYQRKIKTLTNVLLFLALIFVFGSRVNAQIVTDRPDQTESSSTVPKGALQLESGFFLSHESTEQTSIRQLLLPTNLFRYGIARWLEVRLLNQVELLKANAKQVEGISDLEVGTKFQLLKNEKTTTEIAFLTHIVLPLGSTPISSGEYGIINKLCIAHQLSDRHTLSYNIGFDYLDKENNGFTYSIALGVSINKKMGIYLEPYGIINKNDFIVNFDTGFTYLLNNNVQLDYSFGVGINNTMNFVSVGISWLTEKN